MVLGVRTTTFRSEVGLLRKWIVWLESLAILGADSPKAITLLVRNTIASVGFIFRIRLRICGNKLLQSLPGWSDDLQHLLNFRNFGDVLT
jgi:hypothetical protein